MKVVASLSQGRTATAQCGLFTHKSVPVIFEPPCNFKLLFKELTYSYFTRNTQNARQSLMHLTIMFPCIVIDLFLNKQKDALIVQIYSVIKLYIFRAAKKLSQFQRLTNVKEIFASYMKRRF